jgi:hypothetical protein
MKEHPDTAKIEAMIRALGYDADNHWIKVTHFTKGRIDFFFIKEVKTKIHLIFQPDNFGRVLRAEPECTELRISKHADTVYPKFTAKGAPRTSCGVGVVFDNEQVIEMGNFLRNLETA